MHVERGSDIESHGIERESLCIVDGCSSSDVSSIEFVQVRSGYSLQRETALIRWRIQHPPRRFARFRFGIYRQPADSSVQRREDAAELSYLRPVASLEDAVLAPHAHVFLQSPWQYLGVT